MIYQKTYGGERLPFDRAQALRYFGYGRGAQPTEEVLTLFDECVKEAMAACAYRVCYAAFPLVIRGEELDLGFTKTTSRSLMRNLQGCEEVTAFAATVGLGIDRLIARYGEVEPLRAYAFQAIGAERVEALCNAFNADMVALYGEKGLYARPRFSCGYGDFPLEKQRDFFAALDCNRKIGLTLNDSLIMSPTKSVTALVGWGKTPCRAQKDKCDECYQNYDCPFKR